MAWAGSYAGTSQMPSTSPWGPQQPPAPPKPQPVTNPLQPAMVGLAQNDAAKSGAYGSTYGQSYQAGGATLNPQQRQWFDSLDQANAAAMAYAAKNHTPVTYPAMSFNPVTGKVMAFFDPGVASNTQAPAPTTGGAPPRTNAPATVTPATTPTSGGVAASGGSGGVTDVGGSLGATTDALSGLGNLNAGNVQSPGAQMLYGPDALRQGIGESRYSDIQSALAGLKRAY